MNICHGGGTQAGGQKESMGQEGGGEDGRGEKGILACKCEKDRKTAWSTKSVDCQLFIV